MTENRTTTDAPTPEAEVDTATTDALESVTTTEQVITPDPAAELADEAPAGETDPGGNAFGESPQDAEEEGATSTPDPSTSDGVASAANETGSPHDVGSSGDAASAGDGKGSAEDVGSSGDDLAATSGADTSDDAVASDDVLASTSEVETSDVADTSDDASSDASDDTTSDAGVGAPFGEEEGVLSGVEVVVDDATMRRALEAILMVTDEPLPALTLARTVGRPTGDVTNALNELAGEYTEQGRGFDLREVGGGWRYYTRADAAQYVERFVLDGQQSRLTQAALETLAVVAYKQPVSRARVSAIRGVNVDGVMRTLISRGLVEEAGADTESQATLYRTTSYFLERMGMQSLDDLPELAPYLPDMDDMEDELAAQNAPTIPEAEAESGAVLAEQTETAEQAEAAVQEDDAVFAGDGAAVAEVSAEYGDARTAEEGDAVAERGVGVVGEGDEGAVMADDGGRDDELEPAEELEAGGDEIETAADPAEIPAGEEDADGNDDDDESADFDAAVGDLDDDDEDEDDDLAIDAVEDVDAADDDDLDEDDESVDERLEAAEDLELAGVPDESDDEPVAGGSQYGTEANERDE